MSKKALDSREPCLANMGNVQDVVHAWQHLDLEGKQVFISLDDLRANVQGMKRLDQFKPLVKDRA